jgi:hypothetical protein
MKTLLHVLVLFVVVGFSTQVKADGIIGPTSKHKSTFVFKAERKMVGAQIEVYASNGRLLTTQTLYKKKMIIDFGDAHYGTYTIRLTKGENEKEFQFIKK